MDVSLSWKGFAVPAALAVMFSGSLAIRASAADLRDLPVASQSAPVPSFFDQWAATADEARATQPHWMTPLATVTPRLEQEFRYDQFFQHRGDGADLTVFDGGKGLELIPTTTNEILLNLPAYTDRELRGRNTHGWSDDNFLTIKQRFISANEENGNYIVTGFLGFQAPTGDRNFTLDSWVITPTLAAGKGWGDFDIQATVGVPIPLSHEREIGTSVVTNVTFQYHLFKYFWPELEFNHTHWFDGARAGRDQLYLTAGVIFGRFEIAPKVNFIIGAGYQTSIGPKFILAPAITPLYDHAVLVTSRITF